MKKTLKALVCALMAVVMILSMTACGGGDKESEKVVTSFLDAAQSGEYKKASEYVVDGDEKDIPYENIDEYVEEMAEGLKEGVEGMMGDYSLDDYDDDFASAAEAMVDKMIGIQSYTIEESEEKDGEYIYTVKISTMDSDAVDEEFVERMNEEYAEMRNDLIESGKLKGTDSVSKQLDALVPDTIELYEDIVIECIEDADKEEKEITITVSKEDGEWLISDSDVSELDKDGALRKLLD